MTNLTRLTLPTQRPPTQLPECWTPPPPAGRLYYAAQVLLSFACAGVVFGVPLVTVLG